MIVAKSEGIINWTEGVCSTKFISFVLIKTILTNLKYSFKAMNLSKYTDGFFEVNSTNGFYQHEPLRILPDRYVD